MALKECKECGHEVSTSAKKCPNCGIPDPTASKIVTFILYFIGISLFVGMCNVIIDDDSSTSQSNTGFSKLSLNVRQGPSTDHDIVTTLTAGEKVNFLDDSLGWKRIKLVDRDKEIFGWASGKYLAEISEYKSWKDEQSSSKNTKTSASNSSSNNKKPSISTDLKKAIWSLENNGQIERIDEVARNVYVNPYFWVTIDATQKENLTINLARYVGYLNEIDGASSITVKDSQSGKTLAEYGLWGGVEIK